VENLPVKKPRTALTAVWSAIISEDLSEGTEIELIIRISENDLPVRDLSAILEFIDSIYGRLSHGGILSYSRIQHNQLRITQIRKGSWELILEGVISKHEQHAELLVIIWLAVKYLPPAIHSAASAYHEYEQGRLAREQRKQIRYKIEEDEILRTVPKEKKQEIAYFLNTIYQKEHRKLFRVSRFIRLQIIDIVIRLKR
jgi:hypothetical protein